MLKKKHVLAVLVFRPFSDRNHHW